MVRIYDNKSSVWINIIPPIWIVFMNHTNTQYMDFVNILYISLALSTIYFVHFSGWWASFVYSCHLILECYNLFSGIKYKIVLFMFSYLFSIQYCLVCWPSWMLVSSDFVRNLYHTCLHVKM